MPGRFEFVKQATRILLIFHFRELIVQLLLDHFGHNWNLPEHIKAWSATKKLEWLLRKVDPVVNELFVQFPSDEQRSAKVDDELYCSSISFLRNMMDFMVFNDVILNGDVTRVIPMLKRLAPLFVSLTSLRSKYAIECINLIAKLKFTLSERDQVKVLLQAFVNTSGLIGKNKAADMQQENNIKMVKSVFKGMGAGKTDAALIRASKAAPAVSRMSSNFQRGFDIALPKGKFERHEKKSAQDKLTVREQFSALCPFKIHEGRNIGRSIPDNTLQKINKSEFKTFVTKNANRAINQCDLEADV